ncbi:MAG: SH3 domain-containing protein [Lachnospiraceae bacterium]|nr:SH3 domain-containing protein [Lachnospiraceae bacterium]
MKKTTYIITLITAILLIGCGNTDSSDTPTDTVLSDEVNDAASIDETQPANDESVSTVSDSTDITENMDKKETESDVSGIDAKTKTDTDADETSLPEYTVTSLEETKTMYATDSVNVRIGPSTDYDIIGGLKRGQEITVTGQADTLWYEVMYGEDKAFISDKYLQDEKPIEELAAVPDTKANENTQQNPEEAQTPSPEAKTQQPVTEVKNVAGVIFVGDSRFVQMQNSVGENSCTWIAESAKGYKWFNENAIARIDNNVGSGSKILINLGVNDVGNLQKYISLVNTKANEWVGKGATVYYSSVNPVWENPYVTEEQVEYFNSQMQANLNENVHWIDSHSYLNSVGYRLVDGLHYSTETYQTLYAYYMSCM